MLRTVDRVFAWLLILGSAGHTIGTLLLVQPMTGMFIWSLGSSLAAALLGVLNLVRAGRPEDRTIALIATVGTACWACLAFAFGMSIGNIFDPRPMMHVVVSIVLVILGAVTLTRSRALHANRDA